MTAAESSPTTELHPDCQLHGRTDAANRPPNTAHAAGEPREDTPLGLPRECWSPPVSEAQWCGVRPRLSRLLLFVPAIALVAAYLSAAAAAGGHLVGAGWLLAAAVLAILAGAVALAVHTRRVIRYRAEVPR